MDSVTPISETFYSSGGSDEIHFITNFLTPAFLGSWNLMLYHISRNRNVDSQKSQLDWLHNHVLKKVDFVQNEWLIDFLGNVYNMKVATKERLIVGCIKTVKEGLFDDWIKSMSERYAMALLVELTKLSRTIPALRILWMSTCRKRFVN